MLLPDDVRARAAKKVRAHLPALLADDPVAFDIPLHPPTGAAIHADQDAATRFVRAWEDNPHVRWESRNLARYGLGTQLLPARFAAPDNDVLIDAADLSAELARLRASLDALCAVSAPDASRAARRALIAHLPLWRALTPADIARAVQVTRWFLAHPASGVLPRAVAVDGVHGKWLEQHRALVESLVAIAQGDHSGARACLGLASVSPTLRLRFAPGCGPAGLDDVEVPVASVSTAFNGARHPITRVLFLENKETFLAIPPGPGTCLVFGGGYKASAAAALPVFDGVDLYYWGDLDLDGFRILDAVRSARPAARSILMDPATVTANLPLATADSNFRQVTLTRLSPDEAAALDLLITRGHLRIEQERINFDAALAALARAKLVAACPSGSGEALGRLWGGDPRGLGKRCPTPDPHG